MRLGEKIMTLLADIGRRPSELADALKAPRNTVYGWKENNRNPSSEYIIPICRYFGISPNALFEWPDTDSMEPDERELLEKFRLLGKVGQRAVLAEADEQLYRQRLEGDNSKTAT